MALAKLALPMLLLLALAYVCLWFYIRAGRRARLERRWDEKVAAGTPGMGRRENFVERGLLRHDPAVRWRLAIAVFGLPVVLIGVIIYLVNFQ